MNRRILPALISSLLLVCSAVSDSLAQQIPLYSQFFHNQFIYNPAWAGNYSYGSFNMTYRNQWSGLDGAPTTMLATVDFPFYRYRAGFGANITRDEIGDTRQTKAMFTYAYHIFGPYENSSRLSFGFSGGLIFHEIDFEDMYLLHPNDPRILNNSGQYSAVEASFGMNYIFRNRLQLGVAFPQLINPGLNAQSEAENSIGLVQHFLVNFKSVFFTPDGYGKIEPTVMLRKSGSTVPIQYDLGARVTYNEMFWLSGAYRNQYAVTLAAGVMLKKLRIGYARDFAISDIAGVVGSTNEIMIGYKFLHLPTVNYTGNKGSGWGLRRKKVYHPSRPGPLQNQYPRNQRRKKRYRRI